MRRYFVDVDRFGAGDFGPLETALAFGVPGRFVGTVRLRDPRVLAVDLDGPPKTEADHLAEVERFPPWSTMMRDVHMEAARRAARVDWGAVELVAIDGVAVEGFDPEKYYPRSGHADGCDSLAVEVQAVIAPRFPDEGETFFWVCGGCGRRIIIREIEPDVLRRD